MSRKSFVFSPEASDRLERIRIICRLSTASQSIRLALMVLEDLVEHVMKGGTITFKDIDGKERSYHPLVDIEEGGDTSNAEPIN